MANVEILLGQWKTAGAHLERALKSPEHEASRNALAWHQFGTIDLHKGNYAEPRETFDKSMQIMQSIGDRAGEAATFCQLGFLAHQVDRGHFGARLMAIAWTIDQAIGNKAAETILRNLSALCSHLGDNDAQINAMRTEATAAYEADRGHSLIERAFADDR